MRATIQRVRLARVKIGKTVKGEIGKGACVFLGIKDTDNPHEVSLLAEKILHLRFCEDEKGKTNLSLLETKGALLIIPQFTLYADTSRGRRPDFTQAAKPDQAIPLYELFLQKMKESGLMVQSGEFGAKMLVEIFNDGPFTINLDTDKL